LEADNGTLVLLFKKCSSSSFGYTGGAYCNTKPFPSLAPALFQQNKLWMLLLLSCELFLFFFFSIYLLLS
jgi:hypothetical protein